MSWLEQHQRTNTLAAWIKRREKKGVAVTADEVVARIKRNWPSCANADIDALYQAVG